MEPKGDVHLFIARPRSGRVNILSVIPAANFSAVPAGEGKRKKKKQERKKKKKEEERDKERERERENRLIRVSWMRERGAGVCTCK